MHSVPLNTLKYQLNEIDTFICAASFEERCFSLANSIDLTRIKNKVICYNENEIDILGINYDKLSKSFKESITLKFDSNDPIKIGNSLHDFFYKRENLELGNVLVDTTTFTHEGLLILTKFLNINKGKFSKLTLAYVGASEYSLNESVVEEKWLTKGIKNIRSVLGYPGLLKPTIKNHLVVLFGFESERTRKLIEQFEFDKISLGFGSLKDSINSDHFRINSERHSILLGYYPLAEKFEFSLTDPLETKQNLIEHLSKFKNHNIVVAPMNTKLSTIGAALVAFELPQIQLCYVQASEYNLRGYSKPSEDCYLVNIEF